MRGTMRGMPPLSAMGRTLVSRLVLLVLVAVSAVAAHQATYLLRFQGVARAVVDEPAHDAVWAPLVALVAVAGILVGLVASSQVRRLAAHAAHDSGTAHPRRELRSFALDVASLWLRLGIATALVYAFQENIEHILAGLGPSGLDALVAHGPVPVLVVLFSSLLVAAVAALVRWRCRELLARIARARSRRARQAARAPRPSLSIRLPRPVALGARGSRAPPEAAPAVV